MNDFMKKLMTFRNLLITICLTVFITTATNTVITFLIILGYFSILILVFLISIIIDFFKKTNWKFSVAKILLISILGLIIGISTTYLQEKLNKNTAEKFIARIEAYKKEHGKYPDKNQIKIPKSINGILIEDMRYITNPESYIIIYFDGFWNDKVFRSDTKQWYIDD